MFTWMLSSAIAYQVAEAAWGKATAGRTVFTGPLPLTIDVPVVWKPFVDGLKLITAAGGYPLGITPIEQVRSRVKATVNSSMIIAPGWLQLKKTLPAVFEGDVEAMLKSIGKFK